MEHKTIEELISEIESAFAGVKLGNGVSWREADVIDDYGSKEQRRLARVQDEKEDWKKIPLELIGDLRYQAVLAFLDIAGLKYYLPICMVYYLKKADVSDSTITDGIIFTLTNEIRIKELVGHLNNEQLACVKAFLLLYLDSGEYYGNRENTKRLIHDYWSGK